MALGNSISYRAAGGAAAISSTAAEVACLMAQPGNATVTAR
ncbi:MAG: hypothetical protein U5K74_13040 [Gemmatimonadaceae bacterium]|nr:hypothetical protein [Gemmatimonadaceae bacterium]